VRTLLGKPS
jgi:hypothetical protein